MLASKYTMDGHNCSCQREGAPIRPAGRSQPNIVEEKKAMRNKRRKLRRKRGAIVNCYKKRVDKLNKVVKSEQSMRKTCEIKAMWYKNMSRSYWERWNWELQKRKESMVSEMMAYRALRGTHSNSAVSTFHEIDPRNLQDPEGMEDKMDLWIGRGSFGIVKLQVYRGISVAVKELLPKTLLTDVQHKAAMMMKLCNPNLLFLLGISTALPYKLGLLFSITASTCVQ